MSQNEFIFLGCGSSTGVPVIGCPCDICSGSHPLNQRLRSSAWLRIGQKSLLIDAGPDVRQQILRAGIKTLDGVLLTHAHYDHTGGLTDLRPYYFYQGSPLPLLMSRFTAKEIHQRFDYLFRKDHFKTETLPEEHGKIDFIGIPIQYCTFFQSDMPVNGFRIGSLAYISDIKFFSSQIYDRLDGISTLVISALRYEPSDIHLSVDEAIAFSQRVGNPQTWLTHLSHELDYDKTNAYLPTNIQMAYDGLKLTF